MPSAASVKGHRVPLPCSFRFRRAHILGLLASPWGHSTASQAPLHTCEWALSQAIGNGSAGVRRVGQLVIQAEGGDSLDHIGF